MLTPQLPGRVLPSAAPGDRVFAVQQPSAPQREPRRIALPLVCLAVVAAFTIMASRADAEPACTGAAAPGVAVDDQPAGGDRARCV